jgi:AAHS family benzoate transporter-like MFS transporter
MAIHTQLPLTYLVVFLTGGWLFSAQTLVYAAVGSHYPADSRATALGWVSGVGRVGAVFRPWLGGILVAGQISDWGFAVFAAAGLLGAILIAFARQRPEMATPSYTPQPRTAPTRGAGHRYFELNGTRPLN